MKLMLAVPYEGFLAGEIDDLAWALRAEFRSRGWTLMYRKVQDRPTMACRNRIAVEFLKTPCDALLSLDRDSLPTTRGGQPDVAGTLQLIEDLESPDVDVVFGLYMILRENEGDLVPGVVHAQGSDPAQPDRWPLNLEAPYAHEGLVEITGGGAGTHCVLIARHVLEAMQSGGRLPFEDVHERRPEHPRFGARILGHDLAFCKLAADMGYRVWLDNRVHWGHRKHVDLRWVHDLVRNLCKRLDSHALLGSMLGGSFDPPVSPWMVLRFAEELALRRPASPWADHPLLQAMYQSDAMREPSEAPADLVAVMNGERPQLAERGVILMEPPDEEILEGRTVLRYSNVGSGAVVEFGP